MNTAPLLSLRGVSKFYPSANGDVAALREVSADIRRCELLGIFGPSGSGKTTLLLLAGLIDTPSEGEILLNGEVVSTPATEPRQLDGIRRGHIGFVLQKANLIPFLTALENVQVALEAHGNPPREAKRRALSLLQQFEIEHRSDNYPHQLSGGEQQRVSVARALANGPSLILADEPTAALDGARGRVVMNLFRSLARQEGVAVCIVTHDIRAAEHFDRTIELSDGRVARHLVRQPSTSAGLTAPSPAGPLPGAPQSLLYRPAG
jgi:putative ABC transport system ATP-binding protein